MLQIKLETEIRSYISMYINLYVSGSYGSNMDRCTLFLRNNTNIDQHVISEACGLMQFNTKEDIAAARTLLFNNI